MKDFPQGWESFFDDMLHLFTLGDQAIDMYLRVLMAIDSEVVDREIVHSTEVSFFDFVHCVESI